MQGNTELPLLYQKLTVPPETSEHLSPSQSHQSQFSLPVGGGLNQSGTSSYGDSFAPQQQQQQQGAFDNSGMYNTQPGFVDYNFSFGGAQVYNSGAIELDHMCVPSPLQMETIAEYGTYP